RGVWSTSTLTTLLRNRTYIGEAHYGASYAVIPENPYKHERYKKIKKTSRKSKPQEDWIKIPTPALLDEHLFNRVQEQLKKNFAMSSRNRKNDYLLSGLVRHACGSTMAGEGPNGGKNLYYRCTERVRSFPLPPKCTERPISATMADQLVWEKLNEVLQSPELLMGEVKRWKERRGNKAQGNAGDIKTLELELEKLKTESDRYTRAYGAGVISMEQLKEYTDGVNARTIPIKKQIVALKDNQSEPEETVMPITQGEVSQFVDKTRAFLPRLNFAQKRAIVVGLVNRVVVNNEEIFISGRIPIGAPLSSVFVGSEASKASNKPSNTNDTFSSIHRHRRSSERGQVHAF
ncbi:MAG TPA: recombinase family protein, partial [Candidatus Paceibacterota bacterium]|nr:recombinase family protein [Candidatus Paceibacterota bacterium]